MGPPFFWAAALCAGTSAGFGAVSRLYCLILPWSRGMFNSFAPALQKFVQPGEITVRRAVQVPYPAPSPAHSPSSGAAPASGSRPSAVLLSCSHRTLTFSMQVKYTLVRIWLGMPSSSARAVMAFQLAAS